MFGWKMQWNGYFPAPNVSGITRVPGRVRGDDQVEERVTRRRRRRPT